MTIKTKFDLGQTVWFIDNNGVVDRRIDGIKATRTLEKTSPGSLLRNKDQYIILGEFTLAESQLFASKEELLKSL